MLEHLHIKNVALITESEIDFEPGLNILSGETGAGKSMVIDSLNFALGERIGGNFVRKGEKSAVVEALFTVRDDTILKKLEQNAIKLEEDGTVLLTRTMNQSGKTICRINGSTVTVSMMRECAEGLMDIHGQHSHQSLLNTARHIQILDRFCGKKLEEEKQSFISKFIETATLKKDKDGNFDIDKINFRSSFVEQIDKLYDKGVVDFPTMLERGGKLEDTRISVNMNNEQLQDYLSTLKKELDINYMDLGEYYFHDDKIDENYDNKSKVAMIRDRHIEFKLKKNQKVIRMVAIKQYKNFLAKPEGKLRLGLVTHTTAKKQHK